MLQCTVHLDDLSSVPSTHIGQFTVPVNFSLKEPAPSSGLCCPCTHVHKPHTYKLKIKNSFLNGKSLKSSFSGIAGRRHIGTFQNLKRIKQLTFLSCLH